MEYVTVPGGPGTALPAVDPTRPPFGHPAVGAEQPGGLVDSANPVILARLRTAAEDVRADAVRLHRRLAGLLPVPVVLLLGAIALTLSHPALAARLLLDAAAVTAAGALVTGLLAVTLHRPDPTAGFGRWALFAKAPAGAVFTDLARATVGHPASLAGRLVTESVALARADRLRRAALAGTAGSTVLLTLAAVTA